MKGLIMKAYYTLLVKHTKSDPWSIQWGDYNRDVVAQEIDDSYCDEYRTKIICTSDEQDDIELAVKLLNDKDN
jgi:hypothetical protein